MNLYIYDHKHERVDAEMSLNLEQVNTACSIVSFLNTNKVFYGYQRATVAESWSFERLDPEDDPQLVFHGEI